MKKYIIYSILILTVFVGINFRAPAANAGFMTYFCPTTTELHDVWYNLSGMTSYVCTNKYYTWNTNSGLSGEESYFLSSPHYILCNYSSTNGTGTYGASKAYVPAPDSSQTHGAKYYYWPDFGIYSLTGTVDQYNTFGWATLANETWSRFDHFKLSDNTTDAGLYSKHVDLDSYAVICP
jgi:hypothetical protein